MTNSISKYQQQAIDFLNACNATMEITFSHKGKHFDNDNVERDIYNVTIKSPRGAMSLKFGQSLQNSEHWEHKNVYNNHYEYDKITGCTFNAKCKGNGLYYFDNKAGAINAAAKGMLNSFGVKHYPRIAPNEYDILACLTTSHPGSLEDFCSEFGYNPDSIKDNETYKAVLKEYADVTNVFTTEQIEQLQEIQ